MSTQNLIIYKFNLLYHILVELGLDLNFEISFADSEKSLKNIIKNHRNYLARGRLDKQDILKTNSLSDAKHTRANQRRHVLLGIEGL